MKESAGLKGCGAQENIRRIVAVADYEVAGRGDETYRFAVTADRRSVAIAVGRRG